MRQDSAISKSVTDDNLPLGNSYYQAKKGDYCQKVLDLYKTFTLQQFYTWNPSVGSDCSSLWEGYYYCVGVRAAKRRMDVGF
jgi:hypothetical protein